MRFRLGALPQLPRLGLGISLLWASACSRSDAPYRKPTCPVGGYVTVDGAPPDGPLQITCHNLNGLDPAHPTISASATGDGGKFELSTYESGDGVPPGEYALTFEYRTLNLVNMSYGGPDKLQGRYRDPQKSEVKFTVPEGSQQRIDLGTIALTTQ